jgi:hypothetical protein
MAGSKKDAFETALLNLIFCNVAIANIGNGAGLQPSGVAGSFYIALYTAMPTESTQGTEVTTGGYTGYARVAVARSSAGWTVSGNQAVNLAAITFPACTGNSCTALGFAICTAGTLAANDAIYYADLTSSLAISNGITPEFAASQMVITED